MTRKITKETINGAEFTVVWHKGYIDRECFLSPVVADYGFIFPVYDKIESNKRSLEATALPALPRNPKPEDAPLLYRYMAEGITPVCNYEGDLIDAIYKQWPHLEITHAIDSQTGERVEIAITDGDNDHER